jgi:MarR family transcriptional regulator, organic hydroperoxide resistance regulator
MLVHTSILNFLARMKARSKYCGCLYFASGALARSLGRVAQEAFARTGLPPTYAFLLMTINDQPGIQPSEIAAIMHLSPSTVTRLVDKMESKQYLRRSVQGKKSEIFPLQRSKKLDPELRKAWAQLYRNYAKMFGEEKSTSLTTEVYNLVLMLEAKE